MLFRSGQEDIYSFDYKNLNKVTHKDKNRNDIETNIQYVRSSVKQELISQIVNQIKGLAKLKKKGHKVGKLRYKTEFNSIKLKQYNIIDKGYFGDITKIKFIIQHLQKHWLLKRYKICKN